MPLPIRRPSQRLKTQRGEDDFQDEVDSLAILRKHVLRWIHSRLGWKLGAVLLGYINADHWAIAVPISRGHDVIS